MSVYLFACGIVFSALPQFSVRSSATLSLTLSATCTLFTG